MASPSREERPRVKGQRHQDHYDHRQLKRRSRSGPVTDGPCTLQKPCVLPHTVFETRNHVRSQGDNSAALGVESSFADIYTVKETDAEVGCSELLPLPATLCRETMVEVSDSSEGADRQTTTGAPSLGSFFPEMCIRPFSSASRHLNERPVDQWHPQSPKVSLQCGFDGAFHHPHLQHRQRLGGLAVDSSWNAHNVADHHFGGSIRGCRGGGDGSTDGGHMGVCSPASSVSSDGSAAGLVGSSPTAVWEVQTYSGVSGKDGGAGARRKRTPVDADREITLSCNRDQSTDDLKNLFLFATMELESARTSATEEIKKEKHNIMLLLQLLRQTRSERDEAREYLQRLLDEIARRSPSSRLHHLASSSPLESLLGSVSSPVDPGNTAAAAQPTLPREPLGPTSGTAQFDAVSAVIDRIAMNRPLPEKGKLLQAVVETGPLLQTLLVTGPLPRWRNPPPQQQYLVPPVSINGRESASPNQKATLNPNHLVQSCPQASRRQNPQAASQIYAVSPFGFSSLRALCVRVTPLLPNCVGTRDHEDAIGERQKL